MNGKTAVAAAVERAITSATKRAGNGSAMSDDALRKLEKSFNPGS
jgi:hypothetical protein